MRAPPDPASSASRFRRVLLLLPLFGACAPSGLAYNAQTSPLWRPGDVVVMNLRVGTPSNGGLIDGSTSWNDPVASAMTDWNPYFGSVQFSAVRDSTAPFAKNNGYNTVCFSSTAYGDAWTGRTIGYCYYWWSNGRRTEADVLFNSTVAWNSYRGGLRTGANDIRRVAVHEFGHAFGLDHPDDVGQQVSAVMNSVTSSVETLTADDKAGAAYLYGGVVVAPGITTQPQNQTVAVGGTARFAVEATGTAPLSYQWRKDGANVAGTDATLTISNVQPGNAGNYTVVVSNGGGSATSLPATLTVGSSARLVNIATRAYCSTGNNVTIGGFVVTGSASKRVLIRAVGPSLTSQGLGAGEVLADPMIEVHHGSAVVASNDDWGDNGNAAEIGDVGRQIGAAPLISGDTRSSALLITLPAGVYSFVVKGKGNASGIVLLEVYDAETSNLSARFVNIASRAYATGGNGVAIGGFVIIGNGAKRVLLRGVGPTLTTQGLGAGEVLADPTIEVHHGSEVTAVNDDWGTNANAADIRTVGARIGAAPLSQDDSRSAALLLTLQPGVYSFIASGKAGASGIVLVEVYDAD